jgi:glycosyltransferase involved in cell wall biosynthesis
MSEHDNVVYVFAGQGPDSNKLDHAVGASPYTSRFRILGKVPHSDVPGYMSLSKAFILASESEGYPRVAMEAMACGVRLIVSDMPAGLECTMGGKIGTNFRTGDPDDLANKTLSVLNMDLDEIQRNRTDALLHVENNFTKDKELSRYIDCLKQVQETSGSLVGVEN